MVGAPADEVMGRATYLVWTYMYGKDGLDSFDARLFVFIRYWGEERFILDDQMHE